MILFFDIICCFFTSKTATAAIIYLNNVLFNYSSSTNAFYGSKYYHLTICFHVHSEYLYFFSCIDGGSVTKLFFVFLVARKALNEFKLVATR